MNAPAKTIGTGRTTPESYGFFRTAIGDFGKGDPARVWRLRCSKCTATSDQKKGSYADAEQMAAPLRSTGWLVGKNLPPLCPKCRPPRPKTKMPEIIPLEPKVLFTKEPDKDVPKMDFKLQRAIVEALQEHFDEDKCVYRNGYSDEKIARDTGAAPAVVTDVRKAAFGELMEDDRELVALRQRIEAVEAEAKAAKAMIDEAVADVRRRFDSYVQARRKKP